MNVELISYPPVPLTDKVARVCKGKFDMNRLYSPTLVKSLLQSKHMACFEFDWFVFHITDISRVTEAQLLRKRHASFMVKSGRATRPNSMTMPSSCFVIPKSLHCGHVEVSIALQRCLDVYRELIEEGVPEEDARYILPQGLKTELVLGMNARCLHEFFSQRCCKRAQWEIRELANKMLELVQGVSFLFDEAGAPCKRGECVEECAFK